MSEKKIIVVPNEEEFKPAEIPFAVVTGEGVPDYDNVKSKGKRGGMQYSASVILNKKEEKATRAAILEYWEENKPKKADDKPVNWENLIREGKDDYKGKYIMYAKSKVDFDGTPNVIPIVNHEGVKLDPEEYGKIGKGSKGRLAVTLSVYGDDEDAGVSVFISAVKLTKFAKLEAKGGASAFGKEEGEVKGAGGFGAEKSEEKKSKKKGKKKKSKKNEDD